MNAEVKGKRQKRYLTTEGHGESQSKEKSASSRKDAKFAKEGRGRMPD
jgi:hypothetical protein